MVRCYCPATGRGSLLPEYRRPKSIGVCDENGEAAFVLCLSSCRVTEQREITDPDANAAEIIFGQLRLVFDRWEREPQDDG